MKKKSSLMHQIRHGSSRSLVGPSHGQSGQGVTGSRRWLEMTPKKSALQQQASDDYDSPKHTAAHDSNSLRMVQLLSKQRIYRATNNIDVSVMRAKRTFKQISTENEGTVVVEMKVSNPSRIRDIAGIAVGPQSTLAPPSPRANEFSEKVIYFLLDEGGLRRVLELTLASYHPEGVPLSLGEIMYFFDQLNEYVGRMRRDLAQFEAEVGDSDSICSDTPMESPQLVEEEKGSRPPVERRSRHNSNGTGGSSSSSGIGKRFSSQSSTLSSIEEGGAVESPMAARPAAPDALQFSKTVRLSVVEEVIEDRPSASLRQYEEQHEEHEYPPNGDESSQLLYDRTGQLLCVEMHHFLHWYHQMCIELISTRHVDEINRLHREQILSRALPFVFGRKKSRSSADEMMMHHLRPLDTLQLDSPRKSVSMPQEKTRNSSRTPGSTHSGEQVSRSSDRSSERSLFSMSSFFRSPTERRPRGMSSNSNSLSGGSSSTAGERRFLSVPYSSLSIIKSNSASTDLQADPDTSIRKRSPKHKDMLRPTLSSENLGRPEIQGRGLVIDRPGMFHHSPEKLSRRHFFPDSEGTEPRLGSPTRSPDRPAAVPSVDDGESHESDGSRTRAMKRACSLPLNVTEEAQLQTFQQHNDDALESDSYSTSNASSEDHLDSDYNSAASTIEVNPKLRKQSHLEVKARHPPRPTNKRKSSL
jgi:hypothetical protein